MTLVTALTGLLALAHVFQVLASFLEKFAPLFAIDNHPADAAQDIFGAEIELVIEKFNSVEDFLVGQVGIVDDTGLVAGFIKEGIGGDPSLLLAQIIELGTGIW